MSVLSCLYEEPYSAFTSVYDLDAVVPCTTDCLQPFVTYNHAITDDQSYLPDMTCGHDMVDLQPVDPHYLKRPPSYEEHMERKSLERQYFVQSNSVFQDQGVTQTQQNCSINEILPELQTSSLLNDIMECILTESADLLHLGEIGFSSSSSSSTIAPTTITTTATTTTDATTTSSSGSNSSSSTIITTTISTLVTTNNNTTTTIITVTTNTIPRSSQLV